MFNNRLKECRLECGLTQLQVAQSLGVTLPAISQYEKGIREPSLELLVKYCKLLNVSADYLLGLSDGY